VKDTKPPAHPEIPYFTPGKNRANRRHEFKKFFWIKKDFHEFLGVPGGGPLQINVKHAAYPSFVMTESFCPIPGLIQNQIKRIGRLFAGEQSEVNAAAEDRVNESGGIASQQPAITG
jgi:hypothetical protein